MTHHFLILASVLSFLLLLIAGAVLIRVGSNPKSWLQHESGDQMTFGKPRMIRVGGASLSLSPPCGLAMLFLMGSAAPHHHASTNGDIGGFMSAAMFILLAVLFLSLCGPSDLSMDGSRRTYKWRVGAPWRVRVRKGTWDDLSGIYVKKVPKSHNIFSVCLKWKGSVRSCGLGHFIGRENAERFADQTARKLGLPRADPPPVPQLRDVFNS